MKMTIDSECLNIYVELGDDIEPIHVAYYHSDEWEDDAEVVVPSMLRAVDCFTNGYKKELLDIANVPYTQN